MEDTIDQIPSPDLWDSDWDDKEDETVNDIKISIR